MSYQKPPETDFQIYIRSTRYGNINILQMLNVELILEVFVYFIYVNCLFCIAIWVWLLMVVLLLREFSISL